MTATKRWLLLFQFTEGSAYSISSHKEVVQGEVRNGRRSKKGRRVLFHRSLSVTDVGCEGEEKIWMGRGSLRQTSK